jgi:methionine-S-sulfoxide reductase
MTETAIFAGGCFWCMHSAFEQFPGVTEVVSGYTGGDIPNPTYEQVSTGDTGHIEAIRITFNPEKVSYAKLVDWFWQNIDPTDPEGQFVDKGSQYLAGIFYINDVQKQQVEESILKTEKTLGRKLATFLRPAGTFYPAEDCHQSYYRKNEMRYKLYHAGSGRDRKLEQLWHSKKAS